MSDVWRSKTACLSSLKVTGEMICFGYEAGGDGNDVSNDIVVYTISASGRKTEECWYKSPFCGMIHDCGVTENYVVLPLTPLKCSLERLKKGGNHWAWDPNEDSWYGVVPRRGGKAEDIVWFRADNGTSEYSVVSQLEVHKLTEWIQLSTAIQPAATKTPTATSSSTSQSQMATSSSSSHPKTLHPPAQENVTNSKAQPAAGLSTPKRLEILTIPHTPVIESKLRKAGILAASSAGLTTGLRRRSTSTSGK